MFMCIELATGNELWGVPLGGMASEPVAGDTLVFVAGLKKEAIEEEGKGGGLPTHGVPEINEIMEQFGGEGMNFRLVPTLNAIDIKSGVTRWTKEKVGGRLLFSGGYLFAVDTHSMFNLMEQALVTTTWVTVMRPSGGKVLWESKYEGEPAGWTADRERFYLYATSPITRLAFTPPRIKPKAGGNVVCAFSIGR